MSKQDSMKIYLADAAAAWAAHVERTGQAAIYATPQLTAEAAERLRLQAAEMRESLAP